MPTTLLVSTGSYGHNIGEVVFDGESLSASLYKAQSTAVGATYGDAEVSEEIGQFDDEINAQLSATFATTEVLLNGERSPGATEEPTRATRDRRHALAGQPATASRSSPVNNGGASVPASNRDVTIRT